MRSFAIPRLTLAYFAQGRDDPVAADAGRSTHLLHRPARPGRQRAPTIRRPIRSRTLGPGECFPVGALSAGGATTQDLPRARGHLLLSAAARRFPGAAAPLAGVRALLHAGDHRDAEAVAGTARQRSTASAPRSSRRWRARSASSCAGRRSRARPTRRSRDALRRMATAACARSSSSDAAGSRSACSRWSICCAASCCASGR